MALKYPGDALGYAHESLCGANTYAAGAVVRAAAVGTLASFAADAAATQPTLLIAPDAPLAPRSGDVVYCSVSRITRQQAHVVVALPHAHGGAQFSGVIRQQDVRAALKDLVSIPACFRPGDIVRAQVISIGDAQNYYLSTARNDLGVVFAKAEASGQPMVPVSWEEMMCPATKTIEKRKCAKPSAS